MKKNKLDIWIKREVRKDLYGGELISIKWNDDSVAYEMFDAGVVDEVPLKTGQWWPIDPSKENILFDNSKYRVHEE